MVNYFNSAGLPIRFADLTIPTRQRTDELQPTLATSLWDVATAGPVRRLVKESRKRGKVEEDTRFAVRDVDGIVHQVRLSPHTLDLTADHLFDINREKCYWW
jgi:hypothetical protein